jgi:hypothetical protein
MGNVRTAFIDLEAASWAGTYTVRDDARRPETGSGPSPARSALVSPPVARRGRALTRSKGGSKRVAARREGVLRKGERRVEGEEADEERALSGIVNTRSGG